MANPTLDNLAAAVTNETNVVQSAILFINGIAARQQAAVDAALVNGATAEQLAPVQAEVNALNANATALGNAIAAQTPASGDTLPVPTPDAPPAA